MQIVSLTGSHNRQAFDSGREELDDWLQRVALQHQDKGLSKTFVATHEQAPDTIYGYYNGMDSSSSLRHRDVPKWKKVTTT